MSGDLYIHNALNDTNNKYYKDINYWIESNDKKTYFTIYLGDTKIYEVVITENLIDDNRQTILEIEGIKYNGIVSDRNFTEKYYYTHYSSKYSDNFRLFGVNASYYYEGVNRNEKCKLELYLALHSSKDDNRMIKKDNDSNSNVVSAINSLEKRLDDKLKTIMTANEALLLLLTKIGKEMEEYKISQYKYNEMNDVKIREITSQTYFGSDFINNLMDEYELDHQNTVIKMLKDLLNISDGGELSK